MLFKTSVIGILLGIYVSVLLYLNDISSDLHYIKTSIELNSQLAKFDEESSGN